MAEDESQPSFEIAGVSIPPNCCNDISAKPLSLDQGIQIVLDDDRSISPAFRSIALPPEKKLRAVSQLECGLNFDVARRSQGVGIQRGEMNAVLGRPP